MDNLQPAMLNAASGGKGWREHGVQLQQILGRNARTPEASKALWEYMKEHIIQPNVDCGNIRTESEDDK
jgi:putative hydrolase of HD superfamily